MDAITSWLTVMEYPLHRWFWICSLCFLFTYLDYLPGLPCDYRLSELILLFVITWTTRQMPHIEQDHIFLISECISLRICKGIFPKSICLINWGFTTYVQSFIRESIFFIHVITTSNFFIQMTTFSHVAIHLQVDVECVCNNTLKLLLKLTKHVNNIRNA